MEINISNITIIIISLLIGAIISPILIYLFTDIDKIMMRRPPQAVVKDSLKWLLIKFRSKKRVFNLDKASTFVWYDWDRGLGYGYIKEIKDQPKPGDVIQVKIRSNNPKLRGKVMRHIFYRISSPDPRNTGFFIFRTMFTGITKPKRSETAREVGDRIKSYFNRLV